MSHVLLGGDEQQLTELRCLLAKWGVTVGPLAFADDVPTVLACDAVILQGDFDKYEAACLGAVPDGSRGAAGPAAPLILINHNVDSAAVVPARWSVFASVNDLGHELRRALQFSFARTEQLRTGSREPVVEPQHTRSESYRHFLSHELRSPLTAIKTSLEVLEGALGGLDGSGDGPPTELKVLEIALRNVRRLHQTVEWSQDLAACGELDGAVDLQDLELAEVADQLQSVGDVRVDSAVAQSVLQTDPEILVRLAAQMVRTVSMSCPEGAVTIRFEAAQDDNQGLRLVVAAEGRKNALGSRACNTHLVTSAVESEPTDDLVRLSQFMVASSLVDSLGAGLAVETYENDRSILVLDLQKSGRAEFAT